MFFLYSYIYIGGVIIYININDINIHYEVSGKGQNLLLLHGWGANLHTFDNLVKELSINFKVYVLDLPGFGDSLIGLPLSVEEVSDILNEFVLELNIIKPIIIGHSYGTRIAVIYASKYEVDKLILVSATGLKERLNNKKRFKVKVYKFFKRFNIKLNIGSKDYRDSDNVKKEMLVITVNQDLKEYMNRINIPTLLIYGKDDMITKVELGYRIRSEIKCSSMIVLDECGHFPYLDRPNYFLLVLNSFLLGDIDAY